MKLNARTLILVIAALLVAALAWSVIGGGAPSTAAPTRFDDSDVVAAPMTSDGDNGGATAPMTLQRRALDGDTTAAAGNRGNVRIVGRVVDHSGAPLRGAEVRLALVQNADRGGVTHVLRVRTPQTTAGDGRFAFSGPGFASQAITIEVSAAAHAALMIECPLAADATTLDTGDLRLAVGGAVLGQVGDELGRALPGAAVELWASTRSALAAATATTDATGGYRFANVAAGRYSVRADASNRQRRSSPTFQVVDERDTRIETLLLPTGAELSGVVLGAGDAPISGAVVRAQGGRTTSGPDGAFHIPHLSVTPMWVDVRAEGFVSWRQSGIDPAQRLVVRLEVGLRITGTVIDASTRVPVQRFAARARRLRSLESRHGTPGEQIARRLAGLRAEPAASTSQAAVIAELEARHRRVSGETIALARVPGDLGPIGDHDGGAFAFDGLDEGFYAVEVLAPDHLFTQSESIELRRGGPQARVTLALARALRVSGTTLSTPPASPVAGALVELVSVGAAEPETLIADAPRPAFAWALAAALPIGDPIVTARSDADGRYELGQVPAGRYYVQARHPRHAVARSPIFDIAADCSDVRLELAPNATLRGRVRGVPAGRHGEVFVMVLGGISTLRKAGVDEAGGYACEALEPGAYFVRAFLGASADALDEQIRAALARDDARSDVVLAPGDDRTLDLQLDAAATGRLHGSIAINGAPARGARAELRSLDGVRRWSAVSDERGLFEIADLPPGKHQLRIAVTTDGRQELHRAAIAVPADTPARVDLDLRTGGLRGRVLADDGTVESLRGRVLMLPGVTAAPKDVRAYAREHVTHSIDVRNGEFNATAVLAGPALLLLELRERAPTQTVIDVGPGAMREIDLLAGARR